MLLSFKTRDPDEFSEKLTAIAPGIRCEALSASGIDADVRATQLPGVGLFWSRFRNFRGYSERRDFFGVTVPIEGALHLSAGAGLRAFDRSNIHVSSPDQRFDARIQSDAADSLQLCVDAALFRETVRKLSPQPDKPPVPRERLNIAQPAVRLFQRQVHLMWSELSRREHALSPLVAEELSRTLIALLADASTSAANDDAETGRRFDKRLRQVEEHIVAHLAEPLGPAELASVAGLSTRTLARAFKDRWGMTPKAFVRQRRLEEAHRRLLAGDPETLRITDVALSLGFSQLGRFSVSYRRLLGESPSETLAR